MSTGSLAEFKATYSAPIERARQADASLQTRRDGDVAAAALRDRVGVLMLRRTREVQRSLLPTRSEVVLYLGLTSLQCNEYQSIAADVTRSVVLLLGGKVLISSCFIEQR